MHDFFRAVRVVEALEQLARPIRDFVRSEDTVRLACMQRGEIFTADVFHRDAHVLVVFIEIEDAHDVRMRKLATAAGFVFQVIHGAFIEVDEAREEFQRELFFKRAVMREPDLAHATAAEAALQFEAAEHDGALAQAGDGVEIVQVRDDGGIGAAVFRIRHDGRRVDGRAEGSRARKSKLRAARAPE